MAKITAVVDPGKGKVYHPTFDSWAQARAFVRGPHSRDSRVVLKDSSGKVEVYERGKGTPQQRMVAKENTRRAKLKARR